MLEIVRGNTESIMVHTKEEANKNKEEKSEGLEVCFCSCGFMIYCM